MTGSKEPGGEPGSFYNSDSLASIFRLHPDEIADLRDTEMLSGGATDLDEARRLYEISNPTPVAPLQERLLAGRPEINVGEAVDYMLEKLQFRPRNEHWITGRDPLHRARRAISDIHQEHAGVIDTTVHSAHALSEYLKKVKRERDKGKPEAASYGSGICSGVKIEIFATHWDHYRGSIGDVVAQKAQKAMLAAKKNKTPLVIFDPSAGYRQPEAMHALRWISIIGPDLEKFTKETGLPTIVWSMNSYGGTPVSFESRPTALGGMAGTNTAFSGERVIEVANPGIKLPAGSQSMERALIHRNIQMLARNPDEILEWLEEYLRVYKDDPKTKFVAGDVSFPAPQGRAGFHRTIYTGTELGEDAIEALLPHRQTPTISIEVPDVEPEDPGASEAEILYKRYRDILRSASRADAEMIARVIFRQFVPFYNYVISTEVDDAGNKIVTKDYPKIIMGLGKFGARTVGFIGNQPSQRYSEASGITLLPPLPDVADYEAQMDFVEMCERAGYPLFALINTPGANPGIESEDRGQPRKIGRAIAQLNNYGHYTLTVVNGAFSSGGAAGSAPMRDFVAGTEDSIFVVADPTAQVAILDKEGVTPEKVQARLFDAWPSTRHMHEFGIVDKIIPVSANPYETAVNIGLTLAEEMELRGHLKGRALEKHRRAKKAQRTKETYRGEA